MTDLYLIAHCVRGEPAFDVAQRIECPECSAMGCLECDDLGYWWIVGTSGHRAYPYYETPLNQCVDMYYMDGDINKPMVPPDGLQDHYITQAAPTRSLTDLLNLRPKPVAPILRRI